MQAMALKKRWKHVLLAAFVAGGLAPALALSASSSQASNSQSSDPSSSNQLFYIYGQAQFFQGAKRINTPFLGTMRVNPNFVSESFGIVGRIVSMAVWFPILPEVDTFDTVLTQGPEISGITPLKYDVTLLNAKGEEAQFQFTTVQSPARFPVLGTRMGSLVDFQGGSLMQGSNTSSLAIGHGYRAIFLQNFRGQIYPASYARAH